MAQAAQRKINISRKCQIWQSLRSPTAAAHNQQIAVVGALGSLRSLYSEAEPRISLTFSPFDYCVNYTFPCLSVPALPIPPRTHCGQWNNRFSIFIALTQSHTLEFGFSIFRCRNVVNLIRFDVSWLHPFADDQISNHASMPIDICFYYFENDI